MVDPNYEKLVERTKEGRFKSGVSGNPNGLRKCFLRLLTWRNPVRGGGSNTHIDLP